MRRHVLWGTVAAVAAMTVLGTTAANAEGRGDIRITKGVTNNGKSVVVGVSGHVTFPVKLTIKDNSGVKSLGKIWANSSTTHWGAPPEWDGATCRKVSATTSECTATMRFVPAYLPGYSEENANDATGRWCAYGNVQANDGDYWIFDCVAPFNLKRASTLTTAATGPSPLSGGKQVKVTGTLSRADWEALKYRGYAGQSVQLQFRKAGASAYRTVKTVESNSSGRLSATVTASGSGSWRWFYPGTSSTAQIASAGAMVTLGPATMRAPYTMHAVARG
ncbi:hypothetical protein ACFZAT_19035 [Streptomyces sp. NPDC008163]|uniref:hypothetical protein n=1 Tax=Streptomyces sp. NPDC008163 TaxID=3364818 RepID=UPI0036DFB36A